MKTIEERKESRKDANHAYYAKNSAKWGTFYPSSTSSMLGTGNLGAHKLDSHSEEGAAVRAEMKRLGIRRCEDAD